MSKDMLTLLAPCEIIVTLMSSSASAPNALSKMVVERSTFAIREMMEWPCVTLTLAISEKSSWRFLSSIGMSSRDQILAGSIVSDTDTSEVATTSTEISFLRRMSNTLARNPYCPSMRVETMSSSVTFFLTTMEVRRESSIDRLRRMTVPGEAGLYEFFTRTTVVSSPMHGCIAWGCNTCAPKYASSVASSNVMIGIATVESTMRGSALRTPSTSFQTVTSFTSSARPRTVALRSLPPRPSVVMAPDSAPRARNPVTTGIVSSELFCQM
mmetsp:Transcript_15695/g.51500  ORF Transcript_15695/g.51500 Transcript_15695/m.51500 type:complete len:269 (+) Transcript_15695:167-973(+)